MKMKKEDAITLISLVITIIILLILAGVTINLILGDEGIFKVSEQSAEETKKAQIKEELERAILEIQAKKIAQGLEMKREDLSELTNIGATIQNMETLTIGNYKNYEFAIDENYKVIIEEQAVEALKKNVASVESINEGTVGTLRQGNELQFSWTELGEIAKIISDNYGETEGKVNKNTAEFTLHYKGKKYLIGVGDYKTLNGKKVEIIGFNHDDLAIITDEQGNKINQYGAGKTNTKAGITFDYVESLSSSVYNSSSTNAGGWEASKARENVSNLFTTLEEEARIQIKKVKKTYNKGSGSGISDECEDYLWLLSCSEIWNVGVAKNWYGLSTVKEGERYRYYQLWNSGKLDKLCKTSSATTNGKAMLRSTNDYNYPTKNIITLDCEDGEWSNSSSTTSFPLCPGFCF